LKISVNEQTQRFYLAMDKWKPVTGHEITVGKYKFCAIPTNEVINVSEVTSGCKVLNIPMNIEIILSTSTKEDSMRFFNKIGESLKRIIESHKNFDGELENMKKVAFEKLGEMPAIENVDTDWVFAEESEILN
jgi:hypothetical protein